MTRSNAQYELLSQALAKHRRRMLRVADPYAGGAVEAEDIVQMAAMTAWRRIETLRDRASVGRWLLRITSNMGRYVAERRARRKQLQSGHFGAQAELRDPCTFGCDDNPRRDDVLVAAESLSPAQREVIHCLLGGMSCEETAAELHKTVEAVHALRHRAVQSLKAILSPTHAKP